MASLISGSLISLSSLYLFYLNKNNFNNQNKFLDKLKQNTKIIKDKNDLKNVENFTPVYVTNRLNANQELFDNDLNIYFEVPMIFREVKMYQLKAVKDNEDKNKTNNENKDKKKAKTKIDSDKLINTRDYIWSDTYQKGRDNPHLPFSSSYFYPNKIFVGPFEFDPKFFKQHLYLNKKYVLANKQCNSVPLPWMFSDLITENNLTNSDYPNAHNAKNAQHVHTHHCFWDNKFKIVVNGDLALIGKQGNTLGDIKISYFIPESDDITILGSKNQNTITPYEDKLLIIKNKRMPLNQIFTEMEESNINCYLVKNVLIGIFMFSGIGFTINGIIQNK